MKKVGIFAGTFDPVHDGHIALAEQAVAELGLDQVYFLVEAKPWGDKTPATLQHRQKMVAIAIEKIATLSQLILPDERCTTTETLPYLEQKFNNSQLFFLLGSDVFLRMHSTSWPHLDALLKHTLVVCKRGHESDVVIKEHSRQLAVSTTILSTEHPHHSSSDIRMTIANAHYWVPAKVAEYIKLHALYQAKTR
jgi:nicotinate-nucleotide adenylyltransferase